MFRQGIDLIVPLGEYKKFQAGHETRIHYTEGPSLDEGDKVLWHCGNEHSGSAFVQRFSRDDNAVWVKKEN